MKHHMLVLALLAGCACPGDDLRLVNPITWHEADFVQLHVVCQDLDPKLRGCVVSRSDGDHIYILTGARP